MFSITSSNDSYLLKMRLSTQTYNLYMYKFGSRRWGRSPIY